MLWKRLLANEPRGEAKKTVMLISPFVLPIPATGGGAIETLVTSLLEVNEEERACRFIVASTYDKDAAGKSYKYSKVYYFNGDSYVGSDLELVGLLYVLYRVYGRVSRNRISSRFFRCLPPRMSKRMFYLRWIAKLERVDVIVNEGNWDECRWGSLVKLVGRENIYNHIHCHRLEDLSARKMIPNSLSISDFVRSEWAVTPDIGGRNDVLYNGIDVARFGESVPKWRRHKLRTELGVSDDTALVLFCGRIIKEKGVTQLLDAFELLRGQPVKLLLIGSVGFSASTDTEYSLLIRAKANSMDNVVPLGYVPNERMPEMYACADIQVIPSICQEGAGLVAIEGMASGLPLVTTISGGMTEYVSDEVAIQVPIGEDLPSNLADAISMLANSPEICEKMSRAGKKRAELFSVNRYYYGFLEAVRCL